MISVELTKFSINFYIREAKQTIKELSEDLENCKNAVTRAVILEKIFTYEDHLSIYIDQAKMWGVYKDE